MLLCLLCQFYVSTMLAWASTISKTCKQLTETLQSNTNVSEITGQLEVTYHMTGILRDNWSNLTSVLLSLVSCDPALVILVSGKPARWYSS